MPEILSRKEAIERGLKRFFTGVVCPRGHVAERSISNGACSRCERESAQRRRDGEKVPLPEMFCRTCGSLFQPNHGARRFCSAECYAEHKRRGDRLYQQQISSDPVRKRQRDQRVLAWKHKNAEKCLWWTVRWKTQNPEKHSDTKKRCYAKRASSLAALKELGIDADINTAYRALKELGIKIDA